VNAGLFLLYLALLLLLWGALWQPRPLPGVPRKTPLLIGHRGVRGSLPENSLVAFERAFEAGLDGVECDVQRSQDGALVLFHDFVLPDGREVTQAEVAALREVEPNLARLEELFALSKGYPGKLLNVELKTQGWETNRLERTVVQLVRASSLSDRVLLSSFNPLSLLRVRLRAPELRVALLFSPDLPRGLRSGWLGRWLHVDALHPHHSLVDEPFMRWARSWRVPVNVWTVNEASRVRDLTALNVNGLMADDPEALKDALEEAQWSPSSN